MRFALITADSAHKVKFRLNPERDDATSFMQWIEIFSGIHLSYESLRTEGLNQLSEYDVVMMSGHPSYIADIIKIGDALSTTKTITMFYPEGSLQLYDNAIQGFHAEYYLAPRACDIVSSAEEDKLGYYRSFVDPDRTIVRFIHVPMRQEMSASAFMVSRAEKKNQVLVYGDNNPNHPMVALACVNRLNKKMYPISPKDEVFSVLGVETRDAPFRDVFPDLIMRQISKLPLNPFLRALGNTMLNFYPTEWIGTARHQISCAAVGTPCIGNKDSHTQRRLFPELGFDIFDVDGMTEMAYRLVKEKEFYDEVVQKAAVNMRFYDFGHTVGRFMSAVRSASMMKERRLQADPV